MESKSQDVISASPKAPQRSNSSFEERFDSVLTMGISPQVWMNVHRQKSNNSLFVDIRRKHELRMGGKKLYVPTRFGVFLRKSEFDEIQSLYKTWINGKKETEMPFKIENDGRRVLFGMGNSQFFKIKLETPSKISELELSPDEMKKVADYTLSENLAFAMSGVDAE